MRIGTDAGHLSGEFIESARLSETEGDRLEDWIAEVVGAPVEIDAEGSVWAYKPQRGRWLTQDECDRVEREVPR